MDEFDNDDKIETCKILADGATDVQDAFMWLIGAKLLECKTIGKFVDGYAQVLSMPDALRWCIDYELYVRWNEHGNEPDLSEVGLDWFIDVIKGDSDQVIDYLVGEWTDIPDEKARDLIIRLLILNKKFRE